MTYFNRSSQLRNTLTSISNYTIPYEIIIVDDGSSDSATPIIEEFPELPIIHVNITQKKKWWINPCMAFNIGFKLCSGDLIIIQNAECYHCDDIVKYVQENVRDNYHAFAVYSQNSTTKLNQVSFKNRAVTFGGDDGWYNHSIYRPKYYHFCAAISKLSLDKFGGFDEDFASGCAYDDDAFLLDINKAGIKKVNDDGVKAIHQYHYDTPNHIQNEGELTIRNRNLFMNKRSNIKS
jgi:glycosyltransferase involved in cell wall biosynthesis